jgi:hypothetical protein
MSDHDLLLKIQRLQFNQRGEAEALLLSFVRDTFRQLDIISLELRPQAISLNSFNGFLHLADGSKLFFKTHTEQDNAISEYYNAEMLDDAGYPVVRPLYSSTSAGQQLLIYPVIESPSVFDVARALEMNRPVAATLESLTVAQNASDDELYQLYARTLAWQSADNAGKAAIHQLFYHRLTGGRLDRFYADSTPITLPHGMLDCGTLKQAHWVINGSLYQRTLGDLISEAVNVLEPTEAAPSVVGHGDAHNGNVFYEGKTLRYFDPAFAGRHHPLLDLVKPIFHNVFAMWMYFRDEERERLSIAVGIHGNTWHVSHDYHLNPVRQMFLISKIQRTLTPTLRLLHQQGWLSPDWRRQVKLALMCCPLLTLNLTTFPPEIALLGASFCIQMGDESSGVRSVIDTMLDAAVQEARVTS